MLDYCELLAESEAPFNINGDFPMLQPSLFESLEPESTPPSPPTKTCGIDFEALWAEMPAEQIPSLLVQSNSQSGRRKIADMIIRNRPDLTGRVEGSLEALGEGPSMEEV